MKEPNARTNIGRPDSSLHDLGERIGARVHELTAALRPSPAPGADVAAEMRLVLEETLGSPEDEMVSFSADTGPSEALKELHAGLITALAWAAAGSKPILTREAIDLVKSGCNPFDLPPSGQPTTRPQLANWSVRQMAVAHQQENTENLALAFLAFMLSHGSVDQDGLFSKLLAISIRYQCDVIQHCLLSQPDLPESTKVSIKITIAQAVQRATAEAEANIDSMFDLANKVLVQRVSASTEQWNAFKLALSRAIEIFRIVGGEYQRLLQG